MTPLYCFKLDEITGHIQRIVIDNYRTMHPSAFLPEKTRYMFRIGGYTYDIRSENIDKCVNWKIYTFTDDFERVRRIFVNKYSADLEKAQIDVIRYSAITKKLGGVTT